MQELPCSLQSFSLLRKLNCLYIDKTKFAYDLITKQQSFFLSRPRRFGKSLFLSTLKEILLGNKELFKGLYIENTTYSWPIYGIVHLDFGPIDSTNGLTVKKSICKILARIADYYELSLSLDDTNPNEALLQLVYALYSKYKQVAILIDEYDHPILQVLQDPQAEEVKTVLQSFFTTVKSCADSVHFLFITGVSMFSKAGVFSGMNNLKNLSMDSRFATVCGYTEEEIDQYLIPHITYWAQKEQKSTEDIKQTLKTWYNGYRFSKEPLSVYNPFSVFNALDQKKCQNFWFEAGSPTFIMKELQKEYRHREWSLFTLEDFKVSSELLSSIDIGTIPLPTLLFQTGYLTLAEYDTQTDNYKLKFPNHEVKTALNRHLLTFITKATQDSTDFVSKELKFFLDSGNIQSAIDCLKILFAQIPYHLHIPKEQFYHGLLQIACYASGIKAQSEYSTSHARIDLILDLPSKIYLIEIKFNHSEQEALSQIENQRYYEPFLASNKPIILLGLNFQNKPRDFQITWVAKQLSNQSYNTNILLDKKLNRPSD